MEYKDIEGSLLSGMDVSHYEELAKQDRNDAVVYTLLGTLARFNPQALEALIIQAKQGNDFAIFHLWSSFGGGEKELSNLILIGLAQNEENGAIIRERFMDSPNIIYWKRNVDAILKDEGNEVKRALLDIVLKHFSPNAGSKSDEYSTL